MKPAVYILRLCLGACICGALAGVLGGAVVGMVTGVVMRNAALGLDGAFWGGVAGAGVGALYGVALAVADSTRHTRNTASPSPRQPAPSPHLEEMTTSQPARAGH